MLKKIIIFCVFILSILLILSCGKTFIEQESGSIYCVFDNSFAKTTQELDWVWCQVKKGDVVKYNSILEKKGNAFNAEIDGLEPGNNYSLVLYGKNINSIYIEVGACENNITIKNGKRTVISLSWNSFVPLLIDPLEEEMLAGDRFFFSWNSVIGAHAYWIKIGATQSLSSGIFERTADTCFIYTGSLPNPFPGNRYYWSVCSEGALSAFVSPFSEVRSFVFED